MADKETLTQEIKDLEKALYQKKQEYENIEINRLKELYGSSFSCDYCAYSCCVYVGDNHTECVQHHCIYCYDNCARYIPENKLSEYIRKYHYYDEDTVENLNALFDVNDILKCEKLHGKALEILKILDRKD